MLLIAANWVSLSLLNLTIASQVAAEVHLDTSRVWSRARTISPGQKIWSLQTSYQESTERFSADGKLEPLGQNFSRSVTWDQLLRSESAQSRADLRAYMRKVGVSENDVAATADYSVSRQELGFEANWAYGLTRTWMIGLKLPVTQRTTRVREQVAMSPALVGGLQVSGQSDMGARVKELAQSELANSGYDRVPDQKQSWDWGDISLLSQESILQTSRWSVALQQLVRLPTARSPSISDYIQTSNDEGQTDLGASVLVDYQRARWVGGARFGYVMQLPDTTKTRSAVSTAPEESPGVHRDLGDWAWGSVDIEYKVARYFEVSAEHSFLSKARDSYSGDALTGSEYEHLADNSDQQLQQSRLGMLYRLGGAGIREGVLKRWTTSLNYTYPWIGRNATDASRTSLELISYF